MATAATTWRRSVLPAEHGVWGLIAAAALVGLPLGGDLGGLGLLLAAPAAVVSRQAAGSLALPGRRRSAVLVLPAALAIAGGGLGWSLVAAGGRAWLPWLGVALALAALHAVLGWRLGRRWWISALAGTVFAALAGAIAVAGGAATAWAAQAAGVLAVHLLLTVPLVRAQTRPGRRWAALAVGLHLVSALAAAAAYVGDVVSSVIPFYFALGLARCLLITDRRMPLSTSARVGLREMAWLPVLATAIVLALRGGLP